MGETPRRLALIPGDGIGPEVIDAAVEIIDAAAAQCGARHDWVRFPWGSEYFLRHGRMMPEDGLQQLRAFDAILLGAVGDPRVPDHLTLQGLLLPIRRGFDQFLCVRPVQLHKGVRSPLREVKDDFIDLVVVRENTEGEYADVGGRLHQGTDAEVAIQAMATTRRRHVTSVTKSNAQTYGMVLWE